MSKLYKLVVFVLPYFFLLALCWNLSIGLFLVMLARMMPTMSFQSLTSNLILLIDSVHLNIST
jgi:hypothetical protein